jgi:hypothetical protein
MITQKQANSANTIAAKEKAQLDALDNIQIPTSLKPTEIKPEGDYNVIFKLVKRRRGRHHLDNFSDPVPNPDKDGTPERMCLLAGATDVWESSCEHILKDKSRYDRARRGMDIIFLDGVCRVRSTDKLRLKFMRLHSKNVGDRKTGSLGSDFYEYSPAKEQEDRLKKQMMKIQMVLKASEMDCSESGYGRKIASFLGIKMVDEDLGIPKQPDAIKTELVLKADTDPVSFQKYVDSTEVEVQWLVRRAISDSKIDLGGATGSVTWSSGKGFIAKIPSTRKPLEYLTELALTNSEDGRRFKEQLQQIIT